MFKLFNKGYKNISQDEAYELMKSKDVIVLDVRTREEYKEKHIPKAINIDVEKILVNKPKELTNYDQKILVYCRSGARSKIACKKLVEYGYKDINNIGGILFWKYKTIK